MQSAQSSPSPQLGKSTYSSATRRDVLWNVVEPGDPYDIRKSMIAKLPGDSQNFMGDNLEIVCLLQSAQIERLCQFLEDYKYRYREIERKELDRHSYQVQIKQLTQQMANEGSFRSENNKLKDFIKKQTFQIEELKNNRHFVDNNLRANYESALLQIQMLLKQNNQYKSEKQNFMLQIKNYIIRIEALQSARDRQLKQLISKHNEESRFAFQNQSRTLKSRYQSQISRLQFQIKRLKQFNDAKNLQINQLNGKNRSLISEIEQLNNQKEDRDPNYLAQMQTRFALMGQQIQRLNLRIKESTLKIDESSRNQLYWKQKYQRLEQDYKSIQVRYKETSEQYRVLNIQYEKISITTNQNNSQLQQQLQAKYQDQLNQLKNEIKRLESQRNSQSQKYNVLFKQFNQLEYNYSKVSLFERENLQLKNSLNQFNELKRKLAQYQTKIKNITDQLDREKLSAKNNNLQRQGYDELRNDYQEFKRKSLEKQRNISERYESEMQRKVLQYESRLAKFAEQSGSEFEVRLQAINRQVQRLNLYLKQKSDESELHKKRIRQLQNSINQRYEVDANRQVFTLQSTIRELKSHNEDLQRKIRDQDNMKRTIAEYQNRIALITQQIQRLTFQLNSKNEQIQNLKKLGNKQQRPDRQSQGLGNEIYLRQEIVQLQRRIKQYEERFRMIGQQNEKINQNLREKVDALNRSEANVRNMNQELQILRKKKLQLESSFNQKFEYDKMQTSRKFTNYEQSLTAIQKEYDQLRRRMADMGNDSNKRVAEYENRIVLLSQQIQRLNQTFKIKINQYENAIQGQRNQLELAIRQNRELQINITQKYELETSRKIGMYEQNMSGLSRELQDLRRRINQYENALRKKNEEVSQLQNRYRVVNQQYQSFKMQVKSFEGEVNRSQSSYQQNMTRITREYQDLKRRVGEYETRIAMLSQQNERLNNLNRSGQQEQQNLKRLINEMKIQITQKYEIETSRKISGYEQNLSLINKQKQDMRRKLQEYEARITNMTREIQQKNRKLIEFENKIRQLIQENEGVNNKFRELQVTVTQKYEVETSRKITTYEQNIQNLGRQLEGLRKQYQNLRINYQKQVARLNGLLKNSSQQHERLIIRMREVQTSITHKYESEVTRQFTVYEQNITNLNGQLEDFRRKLMNSEQINKNQAMELQQLRRRLKQFGDVHRTVTQFESKYNMLRQEFERVSMNLKNKSEEGLMLDNRLRAALQENEELKRKIKQVQINIVNKYQFEINQKSTNFEQNLGNLKRENEEMRRRLAELQNKTVLMTQQIQRLNAVLKGKVEQLNQSELRGRNWQQQIENARRRIAQIEKSSNQRFESQITRTVSLYEQNMTTITRQYEDYKKNSQRSIAQLETKISLLSQQLERASQAIRQRTEELSQYDMRLKNAVQQIQKLQRGIKEMQLASSKRFDSEKTTIISTYQQNYTLITRQFDTLKSESSRKYSEYENKIALMSQEIERLNINLGKKVEDCNNLERRMMQLNQEVENYRRQAKQSELSLNQKFQIQVNRTIMTYEQNFSVLKAELEALSNKNKELTRKISEDALMVNQIERLNQVLRGKVDEAKHYQMQSQKYLSEIQKLKSNISGQYTVEIQRLNTIIRQRTQEYQLLQQKFNQFQSGHDTDYKQLETSYSLVTKQYENSKKHLSQYQQSIRKLYSEFERLQIIINELKVERQTLFDKNNGLLKQIERLNNENKDQQSQLYELRLKFSDEVSLQKRINQHMALMVVLFAEIQTLRQRVKDKEKQVQEVRRSSLAPLKA